MSLDLDRLGPEVLAFLTERHLATLTTLRADGSPHVVPVGFTYDPQTRLARVITSGDSVKARNAGRADGPGGSPLPGRAGPLAHLSGPVRVEPTPTQWPTPYAGTRALPTAPGEPEAGGVGHGRHADPGAGLIRSRMAVVTASGSASGSQWPASRSTKR